MADSPPRYVAAVHQTARARCPACRLAHRRNLQGDARALALPLAVTVLTTVTAVVIRRRLTRAHRTTLDNIAAGDNRDHNQ
jgi:hypothetical protein